jgi:hypothetical protein
VIVARLAVSRRIAANGTGLCAGGELAFRLTRTAAQFINLSSMFLLLLAFIPHAETIADACT